MNGPCKDTYEVVDAEYPSRTIYLTREVYQPVTPAYYTVIPSAHCPKGSSTRYVTAPLQATPEGNPIAIPAINQPATEVEKSREVGATVSGYANIVVKDNLTYEEYQRAIQLLSQIEAGTHHVESGGILQTDGAFTTTPVTYHNEVTSINQPGGNFHPLLVDIEQGLRLSPTDVNGVKHPPPVTPAGFVPLGGASNVGPTAALPPNDPTRIVDAFDKATNKSAIASNESPTAPRDMINKYTTNVPGHPPSGDRAVVRNDVVLFTDPSVGGTGPAAQAANVGDTPTLPRTFTSPTSGFK